MIPWYSRWLTVGVHPRIQRSHSPQAKHPYVRVFEVGLRHHGHPNGGPPSALATVAGEMYPQFLLAFLHLGLAIGTGDPALQVRRRGAIYSLDGRGLLYTKLLEGLKEALSV